MSEAELEQYALEDYTHVLGREYLVHHVRVFVEAATDTIYCSPPARVRIISTNKDAILHWNDEWLDPYWDVELVEDHKALSGVTSMWINGHSYNRLSNTCHTYHLGLIPIDIEVGSELHITMDHAFRALASQ